MKWRASSQAPFAWSGRRWFWIVVDVLCVVELVRWAVTGEF